MDTFQATAPEGHSWKSALRAAMIAMAVALFVWRCSVDWENITPKELRDAAISSLTTVVMANGIGIRERLKLAPRLTVVSGLLAFIGFLSLITYNGMVASRHLECHDRVVAVAESTGMQASIRARAACFDQN